MNIVHVPDNHSQKSEYGFVAVEDDKYVMNPQRKERKAELDFPHEKSADDHHKRSPAYSPVFEFFDEIVAAVLRGIFEKPVGMLDKKVFKDSHPIQKSCQSNMMPKYLKSIANIFKFRDHLNEVISAALCEYGVEYMPYEVEDHHDSGNAMDNSPDVKALFKGKERFQEFDIMEKYWESGDY